MIYKIEYLVTPTSNLQYTLETPKLKKNEKNLKG